MFNGNTADICEDGKIVIQWKNISIKTSWGNLSAKQFGNGGRKVLAVHGWLDNADSFDLIASYLINDITFISIDLPGHGLSDHFQPGFIYDVRSYVGSIKKAVLSLGWSRFTFLGHSMGALVGIMYTAVFPKDVDSFISVDFIKPWSSEPEKYAVNYHKYYSGLFKNEDQTKLPPLEYEESDLIQMMIDKSKSLDTASAKILLSRGSKPGSNPHKRILTRDLKAKSFFIGFTPLEVWIQYAQDICCPVLLLKANDGHTYDTPKNLTAMIEAFKKGNRCFHYQEFEGKHHFHLTHPHLIGPAVSRFLHETASMITAEPCSNQGTDSATDSQKNTD